MTLIHHQNAAALHSAASPYDVCLHTPQALWLLRLASTILPVIRKLAE